MVGSLQRVRGEGGRYALGYARPGTERHSTGAAFREFPRTGLYGTHVRERLIRPTSGRSQGRTIGPAAGQLKGHRSAAMSMNRKTIAAIPEAVTQLQRQLKQFRSTRPARSKLPESIWQPAVELARQHGIYTVAHPLRLDLEIGRTSVRRVLASIPGRNRVIGAYAGSPHASSLMTAARKK
jgi:hypothetical protein